MNREPWARQQNEKSKAFAGFAAYRDMGPGRSLAKALEISGYPPGSIRLFERWSSKYHWAERALAYDQHQDQLVLDEAEDAIRQATRENLEILGALKQLGRSVINTWIEKVKAGAILDWTQPETVRLFEFVIKNERLLMGEPTERTAVEEITLIKEY